MALTITRGVAALLLALLPVAAHAEPPEAAVAILKELPDIPARAPIAHPFASLAGTWNGGGTIALTGDIAERLRCRATYNYGQTRNSLALAIRCASDNYKFELTSNVTEQRGQLSGQWSESTYNVSGNISGRVAGNHITAVAQGDNFNADLSVTTTGNRQSVTITPKATYLISVQITLAKR